MAKLLKALGSSGRILESPEIFRVVMKRRTRSVRIETITMKDEYLYVKVKEEEGEETHSANIVQ